MSRDRRRRTDRTRGGSRRQFLLKLGGGTIALTVLGGNFLSTRAFTDVFGSRTSAIGAASQGNGIVGITPQGTVKKNQRDPMVEFTNNGSQQFHVTVSLDNCGDGGLYDNDDESNECTVDFVLGVGNSQFVDVEAAISGTIPYSINVTAVGDPSAFQLDTTGSVTAETGNVKGAVRIQQPSKDGDFTASPPQGNTGNTFEVKSVDVRDEDDDSDLDRVEFTVREGGSGGSVVGTFVEDDPPGDRYKPGGNPAVSFAPDAGYTIQSGTLYSMTVRAEDADGNFATETIEDTA